jgi:hypothetical protein
MKFLDIDANGFRDVGDFYDALCRAVGAPDWHGGGPDAFVDSMIWGGINTLEPPYTVRVLGTSHLSADLKSAITDVAESLSSGRADRKNRRGDDVDVHMEVLP